ncbi:MAG: hypothetical protein R3F20_07895 [Planctomycetota bacterium]
MTFSDRRIIDAVESSFVPVWETVAPAAVAEFDLGDGRSVKGTVGGEIALYFCRPDGVVFDCLPALQSPAVTLEAIERAAAFYRESGGAPEEAIRAYNVERRTAVAFAAGVDVRDASKIVKAAHATLDSRLAMGAAADDAMTTAAFSKVLMVAPAETVTVVEPGGLWLYSIQIHDWIASEPLRTPTGWKTTIFETILGQKLDGETRRFDSTSVSPLSLTN